MGIFNGVLEAGLIGAVIGGIFGALFGVSKLFAKKSTKEEQAENKKGNTRPFVIGAIIVGIIFVMFAVFSGTDYEDIGGAGIPDDVLLQTASDINSGLPIMVDSETRLDSTGGANNTFIYNYTLINADSSTFDRDNFYSAFSERLETQICSAPELATFREYEVLMRYNYYDVSGSLLGSIEFDTAVCQ